MANALDVLAQAGDPEIEAYFDRIEALVEKVEDWTKLPADPVVSIWMIAYNHARYIRQAIDSVLAQDTPFPFEIVIGDDCSLDETREILREYQRQHPDRIRLRLSHENLLRQGLKQSFAVWNACRGTYIALCECDDFWMDPHKLRKQVQLLDSNPALSGSFHDALVVDDDSRALPAWRPAKREPLISLDNVLCGEGAPTASLMYRNHLFGQFPRELLHAGNGDMILMALNTCHGPLAGLNETMSAYRVHSGGAWSGSNEAAKYRMAQAQYEGFRAYFGPGKERLLRKRLSRRLLPLAKSAADRGDLAMARKYLGESIKASPVEDVRRQIRRATLLARLYLPGANRALPGLRSLLESPKVHG